MSIINPPLFEFPNINFNSSFFTSTNSVNLTQSQANALYLQKTIPDSASAVETFTTGINTNIVQPSSSSANLFLYTIASYALNFGTNALSIAIGSLSAIINIGGTTTLTNFVGRTTSSYTLLASDNSTNISTTSWVTSNFAKLSAANFWTAVNTFTAGLNTSVIGNISLASGYYLWDSANTTVNIATNTAYPLNLGGLTNTTTVNGGIVNIGTASVSTVSLSGTLNFNSPITPLYSYPVSSSQIGYTLQENITATTVTSGAFMPLLTRVTLPAGVWMITYSCRFVAATGSFNATDAYCYGDQNTVINPPIQVVGLTYAVPISTGFGLTGNFVVVSNGSTTYNVGYLLSYTGSAVTILSQTSNYGSSVRRTRIA